MTACHHLRNFFKQNQEYMNGDRKVICESNQILLRRVSVIYIIILSLYAPLAWIMFENYFLTALYILFIFLQLFFQISLFFTSSKNELQPACVQQRCFVQVCLAMGFIISISVFPSPDSPGIFFAPLLVAIAVLFIFSFRTTLLLLFSFTAVYLLLAILFKTPQSVSYDIWMTPVSLLVAFICTWNVTTLRMKDYFSRRKLIRMSTLDAATGLFNKNTFETMCDEYIAQHAEDEPCCLFIVDIDQFKQINDCYGHLAGDRVINTIGKVLLAFLGDADLAGRTGGDEFMLFLTERTVCGKAEDNARHLMNLIRQLCMQNYAIDVSCSIGIAFGGGRTFRQMYEAADAALYTAKRAGKNRCVSDRAG